MDFLYQKYLLFHNSTKFPSLCHASINCACICYTKPGTRIGGLVTRLWRAHFKGQRSRPALICRWGLIHMQQESRTCATDVSAATSARRHIVYRQPHDRTDYSEKRRDVWKVRTQGAWCRHLGWHRPWCRAWGVYGQWYEWSRCCCGWYSVRTTERRRQWERLSYSEFAKGWEREQSTQAAFQRSVSESQLSVPCLLESSPEHQWFPWPCYQAAWSSWFERFVMNYLHLPTFHHLEKNDNKFCICECPSV